MLKFRPLRADEIEVRPAQITQRGTAFLLYKTARTDANILDETVGPENWQNDFKTIDGRLFGYIIIKCGDEWVSKSDVGSEGNIEVEKSLASDAFKRAGFKWGIGRELYTSPFIWISSDVIPTVAQGNGFKLKEPFAKFHVSNIEYADNGDICGLVIKDSKNNTVYTFGKVGKTETIRTTPPEPERELSDACEKQIRFAKTTGELVSIYNAYATTEPIRQLKEACAVRRAELESTEQ